MQTSDLTIEILKDIRDGVRTTNVRLESMDVRLGHVETELQTSNQRLAHVETTLGHVQTAMLDLAQQQRFVVSYVKTIAERGTHVDERIESLESRVDALEAKRSPESR